MERRCVAVVARIPASCFLVPCLLASCVSPDTGQLSHSVTRYDGDWRARMIQTAPQQYVQDLRFDCAPFTQPFFIRINDGVASGFMEADENYSFSAAVDRRGRFSAVIPTRSEYSYKEAEVERKSGIVLVLEGSLGQRTKTGVFVIGDEALDGKGCETKVQFEAL